jgi:hypothetical protein
VPEVCRFHSGITIHQYYSDHNPPHFHAIDGDDEVQILIGPSLGVLAGALNRKALADVVHWAGGHRAELALNWIDALAQAPLKRIGYP